MRSQLEGAGELLAELPTQDEDTPGDDWANEASTFDGSASAYVEYALPHDRGLRASWDEEVLRVALADHPRLDRWQQRADASGHRAREARNARAPEFAGGVDWIEVGPAPTANVAGSGRDAVAVSVGLEIPHWQRSHAEDQRAAEADLAAARARWFAVRDEAAAEISVTLAEIRDTARRAVVRQTTLIPQAESAFESVLGGYAVGEAELALVLLAEREPLRLSLELNGLQARHAAAWAELERTVGRAVPPEPVETRETP